MSAEYNIKICYSIPKLHIRVKRFWLRCKFPSFKQREIIIIWDTPVILDMLHPLFQGLRQCFPLALLTAMFWTCFHSSDGSDSLCLISDSSPSAWSRLCQ